MKRLVFSLALVAGMAFAANSVNAQNSEDAKNSEKQLTTQNERPGFVDADGDGVCGNYDGKRPGKGLGPGHGNGQGRGNGKGLGRGNKQGMRQGRGGNANFVDKNNDGTCDNLKDGTARQRLRDGSGGGSGQNN